MLVLFVVILILFGPRRLPELARMIGRVMVELRRATNDFRNQVLDIEEVPAARDVSADEPTRHPPVGSVQREHVPGAVVTPPESSRPAESGETRVDQTREA